MFDVHPEVRIAAEQFRNQTNPTCTIAYTEDGLSAFVFTDNGVIMEVYRSLGTITAQKTRIAREGWEDVKVGRDA